MPAALTSGQIIIEPIKPQSRLGPIPTISFSLMPAADNLSKPALTNAIHNEPMQVESRLGPIPTKSFSLRPTASALSPNNAPSPPHTSSSNRRSKLPPQRRRFLPPSPGQGSHASSAPVPAQSQSLRPPLIIPSNYNSGFFNNNIRYMPIPADHLTQQYPPPTADLSAESMQSIHKAQNPLAVSLDSTVESSPPDAVPVNSEDPVPASVQLMSLSEFQQFGRKGLEDVTASHYISGALGPLHGEVKNNALDPQNYVQSCRLASRPSTDRSLATARSALLPVIWDLTAQMHTHSHRLKSLTTRKQLLSTCLNMSDNLIADFDQLLL